jgi:anti-sigma factor RsiW
MTRFSRFDRHPDELISASLTGDLNAAERRDLEVHLAACEECQQTLDAFRAQRELLSGLHVMPAPRDLEARVRSRAAAGGNGPWWRRPGGILALGGTLATVAAAALLAFVVLNTVRPTPPAASGSPSASPIASGTATPVPSASATAALPGPIGLQPGDMAYFSLTGPKENRRLDVRNQRSGDAVQLIAPSPGAWGAVQRAALSPDMERLAFAVLNDGKGTWSLYVARLRDGTTTALGETFAWAFSDRLLWSPDGRYLAFTITVFGLGCEVACPTDAAGYAIQPGTSDVWIYDVAASAATKITHVGNAFVASWSPTLANTEMLWMGLAAADPSSVAVKWDAAAGLHAFDVNGTDAAETKKGAFLPMLSPNGMNAIYWRGTLQMGSEGWAFASGGLPYISSVKDGIPLWSDDPLFDDLSVTGPGDGFTSGSVGWSADSEAHAFWGGLWPGIPQPAGYPDPNAVYVGYAAAGHYHLNKDSRVAYGPADSDNYLVDVALSPDGRMVALTLGVPTPEFGASALLRLLPVAGDSGSDVGSKQPAWNGPAVFVPAN